MRVRKFTGPHSRAVLRDVRTALGADAVVLSTRQLDAGGVEILAISDADMAAIVAPPPGPASPAPPPAAPERAPRAAATARAAPLPPAPPPLAPAAPGAAPPPVNVAPSTPPPVSAAPSAPPPAPPSPGPEVAGELKSMRALLEKQLAVLSQSAAAQRALAQKASDSEAAALAMGQRLSGQEALAREVRTLRALLARELAQLASDDADRRSPLRAEAVRRLLGAGLSGALARELARGLPEDEAPSAMQRRMQEALGAALRLEPAEALVERGGVYALVGATGVGKTTTAAKLAARCALRFGARRLALITTDGYRVGAHDQLRTFGKLLGVPVQTAQDPAALASLVAGLAADRHLVLIDTMGLGQRDARLAESLAMLDAAGARRLLLLNAGAQGETLDDVVRAYGGPRTAGCILTKVDEAVKLGPALDCIVRHRLALAYVANGQRVPEDLHPPNGSYLAHRALRSSAEGAFALDDEQYQQYRLVAQQGAALGHA